MSRSAMIATAVVLSAALGLTGCANTQKDSDKKVETAVSVEKKAPAITATPTATETASETPSAIPTP